MTQRLMVGKKMLNRALNRSETVADRRTVLPLGANTGRIWP